MKAESNAMDRMRELAKVTATSSRKTRSEQLWMRSVSFVGLHRILHLIAKHSKGLTPAELNTKVKELRLYQTRQKGTPALTTLYHCRNTLLRLNAITRDGRRLVANKKSPHVERLLCQPPTNDELGQTSREAFANLVLENQDCRRAFFDFFMFCRESYSAFDFRTTGTSVLWRRSQTMPATPSVVMLSTPSAERAILSSASEINAILYGLRYWARDELELIDEFYRENRGSVMYPLLIQEKNIATKQIIAELKEFCSGDDDEWTTLSVQDLVEICGERKRRPVALVFAAIKHLAATHSGQVVLIPTSRSFASLRAGFNEPRQELELRSYFRDSTGRYISHLRLHGSIRSIPHAQG